MLASKKRDPLPSFLLKKISMAIWKWRSRFRNITNSKCQPIEGNRFVLPLVVSILASLGSLLFLLISNLTVFNNIALKSWKYGAFFQALLSFPDTLLMWNPTEHFQVNGIELTGKSHDEAVAVFRKVQHSAKLIIEPDAERKLVSVSFSVSGHLILMMWSLTLLFLLLQNEGFFNPWC